MIAAPIGLVVHVLPAYHEVIWFRGTRLYYYDGVFYERYRYGPGYVIVRAPYGVEVPYLPLGHQEIWRGGRRYYHAHGMHYRPIRRGGLTFFLSVRL